MASVAAGGNITLHSEMQPTSATLVLARRDGERESPAVVVAGTGFEGGGGVSLDAGAEVVEARGGLGMFQTVAGILLFFVDGVDGGDDPVLLPVELHELPPGSVVAIEVGGQSSV
jgi:hypothetical protein